VCNLRDEDGGKRDTERSGEEHAHSVGQLLRLGYRSNEDSA
jgi:hypothetical protein